MVSNIENAARTSYVVVLSQPDNLSNEQFDLDFSSSDVLTVCRCNPSAF